MTPLRKTWPIAIAVITLASCAQKASINFTGKAPVKYQHNQQPLTMYACNNTSIAHSIKWGEDNPKRVPYGRQMKDGQAFFISKYYIASPPLPNKFVAQTPLILGVLSEDHFTLQSKNQQVDIYMDYQLLEPIQLAFLPVDYASESNDTPSCLAQDINQIPINIRCPDFKYTAQGEQTTGQSHGLGKGIGQLARVKNKEGELTTGGQLFIPVDIDTGDALHNCTVEIVNDIILDHQVYFGSAESFQQKIDLSQAYEIYQRTGEQLALYCRTRPDDQPAAGCRPMTSP